MCRKGTWCGGESLCGSVLKMDHTCEQLGTVEDCGVQPPELPKEQNERKGEQHRTERARKPPSTESCTSHKPNSNNSNSRNTRSSNSSFCRVVNEIVLQPLHPATGALLLDSMLLQFKRSPLCIWSSSTLVVRSVKESDCIANDCASRRARHCNSQ